jgi:hypothetical protein
MGHGRHWGAHMQRAEWSKGQALMSFPAQYRDAAFKHFEKCGCAISDFPDPDFDTGAESIKGGNSPANLLDRHCVTIVTGIGCVAVSIREQ